MTMMHADVFDKISNFFHLGGRGANIKRYVFPFVSHMYLIVWYLIVGNLLSEVM